MKLYQSAIVLIALVALREGVGQAIFRLTGAGFLANFGSLTTASFFAGWLAGAISELGPSYGELKVLAGLGIVAQLAIGFVEGIHYLAISVVFILIIHTPISYVCLLLGAALAERTAAVPSPRQEDGPGKDQDA